MIWCFISTSSPNVTVAILDDGTIITAREEEAPMRASGTVIRLLESMKRPVEMYVADIGPGSFTGVKVGVTIAKTLAYVEGVPAAGLTSFDLLHPGGSAAVPSRKDKHLVRDSQGIEELPSDHPRVVSADKGCPSAANAARLHATIKPVDPMLLLPNYVLEPNISTPRKP